MFNFMFNSWALIVFITFLGGFLGYLFMSANPKAPQACRLVKPTKYYALIFASQFLVPLLMNIKWGEIFVLLPLVPMAMCIYTLGMTFTEEK